MEREEEGLVVWEAEQIDIAEGGLARARSWHSASLLAPFSDVEIRR